MQRGKLVVISGPSAGVGKDTLLKMFLKKHPNWNQPPSTTTRQPRQGEIAGKDMNFTNVKDFKKWQAAGKFLETDFHAKKWYGTLRAPVDDLLLQGKNVILRVDVNGALKIKAKLPEAILIFINSEDFDALKDRIQTRSSESHDQIMDRLALAKKELKFKNEFDHIVINKTGEQEAALKQLETIAGTLDS